MSYIETPEDVAQQLEEARALLRKFEEEVDWKTLVGRLRVAHPWHPSLLARRLFAFLTFCTSALAIGVFLLPFLDSAAARTLIELESAIGMPAPVALGICAGCMFVAWLMASMAAVSIGRDCDMLPLEAKQHRQLADEVSRLASQKAVLERIRGTPMGARPRIATPVPTASRSRTVTPMGMGRRAAGHQLVTLDEDAPSYTAPVDPTRRLSSVPPPTNGGGSSGSLLGTARRGGTPLGAPPRGGTPVGARMRTGRTLDEPPHNLMEDRPRPPVPSAVPDIVDRAGGYISDGTSRTTYDEEPARGTPQWGRVDDPWLEDAIEKAEILTAAFPVQAHLQYSVEDHLPFTLVLQRATPAMAVRAMVSFVEFLASIATPPRARIELRSVPHLDRSFHRNVMAALEPYFPDAAEVHNAPGRVDIVFQKPSPEWKQVPRLPVQ